MQADLEERGGRASPISFSKQISQRRKRMRGQKVGEEDSSFVRKRGRRFERA